MVIWDYLLTKMFSVKNVWDAALHFSHVALDQLFSVSLSFLLIVVSLLKKYYSCCVQQLWFWNFVILQIGSTKRRYYYNICELLVHACEIQQDIPVVEFNMDRMQCEGNNTAKLFII